MNRRIENEELKRWLHILGCAATKQAWQPDEQFQNLEEEWLVLFQVEKENSVTPMLYSTVLAYAIVKHFSLQGVGARYLVDISLFVRAGISGQN